MAQIYVLAKVLKQSTSVLGFTIMLQIDEQSASSTTMEGLEALALISEYYGNEPGNLNINIWI